MSAPRRPALVVTVDTEEEGLWSGRFAAAGQACRNVRELPRAQRIFARLDVKPTYLVDHPVAVDAAARRVLAPWARDGSCELGAHLHPWCTPPVIPGGTRAELSYPHQLPPLLQERKLARLAAAIADGFGVVPTSYRAGRWGFDGSTVPVLARLGFVVDTSVKPRWWDPEPGGPSFLAAPACPYLLDARDACRARDDGGGAGVLEVPVGVGAVGPLAPVGQLLAARAPGLLRMRRLAWRAGLRWLEPERHELGELQALVDALVDGGAPVLNVAFHSSTLLPGATPYARDPDGVDRFLARLARLLQYARARHHAVPLGLSEVPAWLGVAPSSAPAKNAANRAPTASSE